MSDVICWLLGGPDRWITDWRGKRWRFEDHPRMGPCVLTPKTGEPAANFPPENSPFWDAVQCWYDQGKRLDANGECVWEEPVPLRVRHIGGGNYEPVPAGEESVSDKLIRFPRY